MYCPDCGDFTLRLIEKTEPDESGEYKDVCTCDKCDNIVYIIRVRGKQKPLIRRTPNKPR